MGYLGSVLLGWMRFWFFRFKVVDPVQNSETLILKHPSRSFGTFSRKIGTHFDPNLQKSNKKTMFPGVVDIPSIVDIVDTVDTADIVHTVDTLDIVKCVKSVDNVSSANSALKPEA